MFSLEISGLIDDGDGIMWWCADKDAQLFGVYRRPEVRSYDRDPEALAEWLSDFPTRAEAEALVALLEAFNPGFDDFEIDGFDLSFEDVRNDDHDPTDPDSEEGWRTFDVSIEAEGRTHFAQLNWLTDYAYVETGEGVVTAPPETLRRLVSRARALGYED